MNYPDAIRPQSTEPIILLPSGRTVEVAKARPVFHRWPREMPSDTYNGKPVLRTPEGEMVFAELAILRIFERAGWQGRWIDSYRHKYRIGYWGSDEEVTGGLPLEQPSIRAWKTIRAKADCRHGGCFDVFCWKGESVIFAESKWRDKLLDTQQRWLEEALNVGIPLESFLIVQWTIAD